MSESKSEPYQLGLALAGAGTCGAYHGGVMDFLLEALYEWEKAKKNGENVPMWDVQISHIGGTSAGAVTTFLTMAALTGGFQPLPRNFKKTDPPPAGNPYFITFVTDTGHEYALDPDDLKDQNLTAVPSYINSNFTDKTFTKSINNINEKTELPSFAPTLRTLLTTTSLRGVPYALPNIKLRDDEFVPVVRNFKDYIPFEMSNEKPSCPPTNVNYIDIDAERNSEEWEHIKTIASAAGAYCPVLPPVTISNHKDIYTDRYDIKPHWTTELEDDKFSYLAVDGGFTNHIPYELVMRQMEKLHGKEMNQSGTASWGSLLMIDPLPSYDNDPGDSGLVDQQMSFSEAQSKIFNEVYPLQAPFKELAYFGEPGSNLSSMAKYFLYPTRKILKGQRTTLACYELNSFAGFIDEDLRLHDYLLGRQNCQYYLKNLLKMKKSDMQNNPIFMDHITPDMEDELPLIPLCGTAIEDCTPPEWPKFDDDRIGEVATKIAEESGVRAGLMFDITHKIIPIKVQPESKKSKQLDLNSPTLLSEISDNKIARDEFVTQVKQKVNDLIAGALSQFKV